MKFEGEYSFEKLVERAVKNARPNCYGKSPRWAAVKDVFGWGSRTSAAICEHFGLDPHEEIEGTLVINDSDEDESDYFPHWIGDAVTSANERQIDSALDIIYINMGNLVRNSDYKKIDYIFKMLDVNGLTIDLMLGFLTTTLQCKNRLVNRSNFYTSTYEKILKCNEDPEALLSNLK